MTLLWEAQIQLAYCEGGSDCRSGINTEEIRKAGYLEGFAAGAASIDTEAIRSSGFTAGVALVPVGQIRDEATHAGYSSGLTDGIEQGKAVGYAECFQAGLLTDKVAVCHVPLANQAATLTVSRSALQAHLQHGDTLGKCK